MRFNSKVSQYMPGILSSQIIDTKVKTSFMKSLIHLFQFIFNLIRILSVCLCARFTLKTASINFDRLQLKENELLSCLICKKIQQ